jgi:acyl-CoA dehydrogenase
MTISRMAEDTSADVEVLAGLRSFIDSYVVPLETENAGLLKDRCRYTEHGGYTADYVKLLKTVRAESARAGYYTMFCPEDIGGGGLGYEVMVRAYEMLYHLYGPGRSLVTSTLAHWTTGPSYLCSHLSGPLREALLDDIVSGQVSMCFAMSEPDGGSDAWNMSTAAVRDGGQWCVNGTKQWITGSPYADYCFLFAVTDRTLARARKGGITCFLVPMTSPGVSVDSVIRMFGHIGGNEGIVSFTDVRVPDEHVVGELGAGMHLALRGVNNGKVYNSGVAVGIARWAFEIAAEYAGTRHTFGAPISRHQGVSFKLADSAIEIHAARLVALDLARRLDQGELALRELAMSKVHCVEAAYRVVERCMQVCGAMGLTNEMRLTDGWHHLRSLFLADGSAEVLRRAIANYVLKGDRSF